MLNEKNYNAIDIMRLIMALLVIEIHCPIISSKYEVASYIVNETIARFAVPFFFIVSSFFFFSKFEGGKSDFRKFYKYEKRLIVLYVVWSIIYFPSYCMRHHGYSFKGLTIKIIIYDIIIYLKRFLLGYPYIHLWYVYALIILIALVFFMSKLLSDRWIAIISSVVFLSTNLLPGYIINFTFLKDFTLPFVIREMFGTGFLCIAIGYLLCKYKKLNLKRSIITFLLIFIFTLGVCLFTYKQTNVFGNTLHLFLVILCATTIFVMCKSIELRNHKVYMFFRKYSSLIYFTHLLGEIPICIVENMNIVINQFAGYFIELFVALIISTVVIFLSKKKFFEFFKKVY